MTIDEQFDILKNNPKFMSSDERYQKQSELYYKLKEEYDNSDIKNEISLMQFLKRNSEFQRIVAQGTYKKIKNIQGELEKILFNSNSPYFMDFKGAYKSLRTSGTISNGQNKRFMNKTRSYGIEDPAVLLMSDKLGIEEVKEMRDKLGDLAESRLLDDFISQKLNKGDANYIQEKKIALDAIKYVLDRTRDGYKKDDGEDRTVQNFNQITINMIKPEEQQEVIKAYESDN